MFTQEPIKISDRVETFFRSEILPLKESFSGYKLAVTGPISVGKSTLLETIYSLLIKYEFEIQPILEYINYEPELGGKLLKKYIKGDISNSTFQNYILDTYNMQFKNSTHSSYLLERTLDDSIMCFANISHYNGKDLGDFDLYALYNKMKQLDEKYDIPNYDSCNFAHVVPVEIDDTVIEVLNYINLDINAGIRNRVIGLSASLDITKRRIKKRGRDGEDDYPDEYLSQIIRYYDNLYKAMKHKKQIKFTELASLIQ